MKQELALDHHQAMPSHCCQNTLNLDNQAARTSVKQGKKSSDFQKIRGRTCWIEQHCPDRRDLAALLNADTENSSTWLQNYSKHHSEPLISDRCWNSLASALRKEDLKIKSAFFTTKLLWVMRKPGSRLIWA